MKKLAHHGLRGHLARLIPLLVLAVPFVLAACGNNGSAGY